MKKLLFVLALIAFTASCTPEKSHYENDNQLIDKEEIHDDDI